MDQAQLGKSGLLVSPVCLGTMTFGAQSDVTQSFAILDAAADAGVNFIDTADVYPPRGAAGATEEIIGQWLSGKRDQFVIATKCGMRVGAQPWDEGCSRKHIIAAVEESLSRLGTDYIDLYQLHVFDRNTPVDETLAALDDLMHSGKVRSVGCSNWLAYQVALALGRSDLRGYERFSAVQPRYNLLHRAPESELLPLCLDQGIGVLSYNPLAGGLLTMKHQRTTDPSAGTRFALSAVYRDLYWHEREFDAVEALRSLADNAGVPVATLSVAWVLAQKAITSAIVGASRADQLAASLVSAEYILDADLEAEIDAITRPFRNDSAI